MRLAEVLLRVGCALVAWMLVYAYCIWTATVRVVGCGPDGDELFRLLLGFVPFALGASAMLNVSGKLAEVHRLLRWLGAPLVVLLPLAAWAVWPWLLSATFAGGGICADEPAAWHFWWAPAQGLAMLAVAVAALASWRDFTTR